MTHIKDPDALGETLCMGLGARPRPGDGMLTITSPYDANLLTVDCPACLHLMLADQRRYDAQ